MPSRFDRPRVASIVLATYRRHRGRLTVGLASVVIGQVCVLLAPKYVGMAVDQIKTLGNLTESRVKDVFTRLAEDMVGLAAAQTPTDAIGRCLAGLLAFAAIGGVFAYLKRYYVIGLSRRIELALRERLFGHVQRLPMAFFTRMRSGDLLSRSTSDIETVRMAFGPSVMYIAEIVCILPLAVVLMLSISPPLMGWALLPLAMLTASTLYFAPRTRRYSSRVQEAQADLAARAQENFSGVRVVKAFCREAFEADEFEKLGDRLMKAQLLLARNSAAQHAIVFTLNGAGVLIFLYFGAREIAAGALSFGQFLEFNLYFFLLFWPMIALGWVVMLIVRGRVSARRINDIFAVPLDSSTFSGGATARDVRGEVEFRAVDFSYLPNAPVLRDIGFRVSPGKTLGILGPVGSGKSSIAALLLRLRDPERGEILIDGRPVAAYDAGELRALIGYVPQETFLFSESIGDNIAFGLEGYEEPLVREFADVAQLAGEIDELPHGYATLLGERGVNLSGGQKQRAAIARALVKRPRIVILDDCLSAVDTRTEAAILAGLKRVLRQSTNIIIAQRVSALSHADEIVVLDAGRIVERGTDTELRAADGLYAAMARRQALQESLAEGS